MPVPPQRAFDPGRELPAPRGRQVDRQRVSRAEVVADDRVLPGGDAPGVQVSLGQQQASQPVLEGNRGNVPAHQCRGALVQAALRCPAGLALDPAVRRIRCAGVDPGQFERAGACPRPVRVPVQQEGGAAAGYLVEQLATGGTAGEPLHPPAGARDPGLAGVGVRV